MLNNTHFLFEALRGCANKAISGLMHRRQECGPSRLTQAQWSIMEEAKHIASIKKLANAKLRLVWEDNYKPSVKICIYMSKDYSSTIYHFYTINGFLSP